MTALAVIATHRPFSSFGEQGLLFFVACGLLVAMASLVSEDGL